MDRFTQWMAQPLGQRLAELEAQRLHSIIDTLFGYEAVVLGSEHFLPCLKNSHIRRHTLLNPHCSVEPGIRARYDKLPLATESVDLIYLPHCLEFAGNPHEVLRESYRALRQDGHLIISMFNPWGLWGARRLTTQTFWRANFISLLKLQDWLALLGFDIMRINRFAYMLPINRKAYPAQTTWFERVGQKFEVPFAGAYVVEASKRIIPLNPLVLPKSKWQEKPQSAAIVVDDGTEPTT